MLRYALLLALIVVISGCANGAPYARLSESGYVTINMTDSGFQPTEVTIISGDLVRFENVGSRNHWPASDVHPTHQKYAGFDSLREVTPGDYVTLIFLRKGTWTYHDHLNPDFKGAIIVR